MPKKIRELIAIIEQAGFINKGGKGSHRNYFHPSGVRLTISGNLGDDALRYQEHEVLSKLKEVSK